ncbi:RNA polymerase sigma factor [Phytohabitans rumicis]|uniref:RNA polymerase sigma factor n=1 Tax=Phytohabitans rumicis TaxID=1076125 RepID=A0A6V8LKN4_9ACTN|nr:sigma-70 family RNA polymerase sigma factor [Phytohabitans rumicis]GFJ95501.1 RNA polymerase sigma factor [Phytohabitans rumicis]
MGTVPTDDLATLVRASVNGDEGAWNELVRRHAGLVAGVIWRYRLSTADAQDVSQLVWLHLIEHLAQIREPAALPGWLVTTTRHECQRYLRVNSRSVSVDPAAMTQLSVDAHDVDEELLAAERVQVLRAALAELSPQHRELLVLLAADPPCPYAEISRILGIPIGSIGPTRSRALDKLRETAAVKTYLQTNGKAARTGGARHALAELE